MRSFKHWLCLLLASAVLTGCSGSSQPTTDILTPLDFGPVDPSDAVLINAVQTFLKTTEAPVASTYEFVRIDLNGDTRRDALVLFKTPYGYWCGIHGCTMLVLKAHNDKFSLVNAIQPIREPVYISNMNSKGWKNIVLRVSGRADKAKDVVLMFGGRSYPEDPSSLPPYAIDQRQSYTRIFYE